MNALIIKLNGKPHATIAPEYSPGTVGVLVTCHLNPKFSKKKGQLFQVNLSGMQESKDGSVESLRWPKVSLNRGDTLSIRLGQVKKIDRPFRSPWESAIEDKSSRQKSKSSKTPKKKRA